MNIEVDYVIKEEVIDLNDIYGGIALFINGKNIINFINRRQDINPDYKWRPEYAGSLLHHDFIMLVKNARRLADGTIGIYQDGGFKFESFTQKLILEPVSADDLRVAYRVVQPKHSDLTPPRVVPESARGYLVDRCTFCQAVSDAAHEYVAELESMPLEWGLDLLEEFKNALDELDDAIDTCSETPPE